MATGDSDDAKGVFVALPRSRSRILIGLLRFGLFALTFTFTGVILLNKLLTNDASTLFNRFVLAVLAVFSFLIAVLNLVMLRLVWNRPLAILKSGIELRRQLIH
jgi:hypothetical protein